MDTANNYWQKYYKDKPQMKPSQFSQFCLPLIPYGAQILDIGSGDGRDVSLLRTKGDVYAVDPNNFIVAADHSYELSLEEFVVQYPHWQNAVFYARWFLHAVKENVENILLDFVKQNEGTLMVEFRALGDVSDNSHYRRPIDPTKLVEKLLKKGFVIEYLSVGRNFSVMESNLDALTEWYAKHPLEAPPPNVLKGLSEFSHYPQDNPYLCRLIANYKRV